jgi:hypothetical protein
MASAFDVYGAFAPLLALTKWQVLLASTLVDTFYGGLMVLPYAPDAAHTASFARDFWVVVVLA